MNGKEYWFVSHCSKDIQIVEQIVDILKDCGISYWKAPEMIPAGSNYAREIPHALKDCSIFLFIVSKASQSSIWVEKEVDIAINCRKKIIPIRIDEMPLNEMYRFYLNNIQTVDVFVQANGKIPEDVKKKLATKFMENMPQKEELTKKKSVEISGPKIDTRTNALRINRIPMQCDKCGTELEQVGFGIYKCVKCNIEYYDDFQKIRNFVKENGPAPVRIIAKRTGVPRQTVESFFSDNSTMRYSGMNYRRESLIDQLKSIDKGI